MSEVETLDVREEVAPVPSPASTDLIVLEGLTIRRGSGPERFVLEVPELAIGRGSFTSILGPSGCGKTSLLTVLGLLRGSQDDPELEIDCRELSFYLPHTLPGFAERRVTVYRDVKGARGGERLSPESIEDLRQGLIGFCLQGGELVPSLTLRENVAVPAHLCRSSDARARADASLANLDMSDHLSKLPGELSGGQLQRGVLARSLVHDPPLVILDEPTSSLDRFTAEESIKLLKRRARERGQTVLMVTHDADLARRFSDRIIEMNAPARLRGAIVGISRGEPEEAAEPADPAASEATEVGDDDLLEPEEKRPVRHGSLAYYLRLAILDAVGPIFGAFGRSGSEGASDTGRVRRSSTYTFALQLFKNSLVAVAIGLLVLMLRGIRSGMVEELRDNLVRSPTARELVITPVSARGALDSERIAALARDNPEIDLVIPQTTQVVSLAEDLADEASLTLSGTLPEDPKLTMVYSDQDFSGLDADSLIVSSALAKARGLEVGSELTLWVTRYLDAEGSEKETSPAVLRISNILEDGDAKRATVHLDFMRQISDYKAGRPVPERDWQGFAQPIPPRYAAYLLFAKRPLSPREERALRTRGLVAEEIADDDPRANLYGRLKDADELAAQGKLAIRAYAVLSGRQEDDLRWLDPGIGAIEQLLIDSDAILVPWNEPLTATVDGREVRLVGLSANSRWLKGYLRHRRGVFSPDEHDWQLAWGNRSDDAKPAAFTFAEANLELEVGAHGDPPPMSPSEPPAPDPTLQQASSDTDPPAVDPASADPESEDSAATATGTADPAAAVEPPSPSAEPGVATETVVVPSAFLAHLHMATAGLAVADLEQGLFRPARDEEVYYQARVFVDDVFQVTTLHERLAADYGVRSNQARVREVQRYSEVLDLLVTILSILAIVIALLAIYVVFHEISMKKKRMIGTLRIMGLPQRGVLVLLLVRGVLVAAVASGLILVIGEGLSLFLNTFYDDGICLLSAGDYAKVMAGILVICFLAVLYPAWSVSKLDPLVALEQAKLSA